MAAFFVSLRRGVAPAGVFAVLDEGERLTSEEAIFGDATVLLPIFAAVPEPCGLLLNDLELLSAGPEATEGERGGAGRVALSDSTWAAACRFASVGGGREVFREVDEAVVGALAPAIAPGGTGAARCVVRQQCLDDALCCLIHSLAFHTRHRQSGQAQYRRYQNGCLRCLAWPHPP